MHHHMIQGLQITVCVAFVPRDAHAHVTRSLASLVNGSSNVYSMSTSDLHMAGHLIGYKAALPSAHDALAINAGTDLSVVRGLQGSIDKKCSCSSW
jgi:hypothetical protein